MSQRIVLAGLLTLGKTAWVEQASRLDAGMFHGEHREVYEAIASLYAEGLPADPLNVATKCCLPDLVDDLSREFVSPSTFPDYVNQLVKDSVEARARAIGADLMESGDADEALQAIMDLQTNHGRVTTQKSSHVLTGLFDSLQSKIDQDVIGIPTGLKSLDEMVALMPGNLCIIAARPRMGKTTLMLNTADRANVPVGIFSLEMTNEELMTRMIAARGVDYGKMLKPRLMDDRDWERFTKATAQLRDRLWLCDVGGLSIGALEAEARRMVKRGCKLICVDYLQLVTCRAESRLETVSEVARRLKALAKNLAVPILCLCQLNRSIETRVDTTPRLSDLRESGQIEQDADQIIFIDRPEVTLPGTRPGEADLHVAKNRAGRTGTVAVSWSGEYQRFQNLEKNW